MAATKAIYKVKSNDTAEPLGMDDTLNDRLIRISIWFATGDIDVNAYLQCLEEAFVHWGWHPPDGE